MTLQDRLSDILDYTGLNRSDLAKKIGVKVYKLQDISRGQTVRMPSDVLDGLIREFPDINPTWLLTGEGEMLLSDSSNAVTHNSHSNTDDLLQVVIKFQDLQIKSQEQIDRLLGIIERMQQQ